MTFSSKAGRKCSPRFRPAPSRHLLPLPASLLCHGRLADLVRTCSYADLDTVLRVHAMRAAAEARAMERRARTAKSEREGIRRPVV